MVCQKCGKELYSVRYASIRNLDNLCLECYKKEKAEDECKAGEDNVR